MATRLAQPGEIFYDAAGFTNLSCVRNAARVGDHISLYMGGLYGCARAHVEAAWSQGAGVVPNWERNADQALRGYSDGRASVDSAAATCQQWGLPLGHVPVIFSGVDFGPTTSQYVSLDAWHRGLIDRGHEIGMWVGAYGATAYLQHLSQQPWWPDTCPLWVWAGSGTIDVMHVKQKYGSFTRDVSQIGCTVDENVVHRAIPVWTGDGPDQPKEKDEMTEAEWTRLDGLISQRVFDVVLGLWREPEVHQIIHDAVPPSGGLASHTHDGGPTGPAKPA